MQFLWKLLPTMALTVASVVMLSSAAVAQPLTFSVAPTTSTAGLTNLGYTEQGWMKVPVQDLHQFGPQYAQLSGVKLSRGSLVPAWIDTAQMQSIRSRTCNPAPTMSTSSRLIRRSSSWIRSPDRSCSS
jgi:hypothetical protein